jgi:hypothetical protein
MKTSDRIVVHMPVDELWDGAGSIDASRGEWLDPEAVRQLVQSRAACFVIADVGHRLRWIAQAETAVFWKVEVRPHLVDPDRPFDIFSFPEGYAYVASAWIPEDPTRPTIILLEKHH